MESLQSFLILKTVHCSRHCDYIFVNIKIQFREIFKKKKNGFLQLILLTYELLFIFCFWFFFSIKITKKKELLTVYSDISLVCSKPQIINIHISFFHYNFFIFFSHILHIWVTVLTFWGVNLINCWKVRGFFRCLRHWFRLKLWIMVTIFVFKKISVYCIMQSLRIG